MGGPRTVVGVRVTNEGTDRGSLTPMLDQIEQRTGQTPEVIIADGGHEHHACICNLVGRGVLPLVSPRERTKTRDYNDEPAVDAWRHIMQTPEAKQLYRARADLRAAERTFKTRVGLERFLVRGLDKVTSVVLLTTVASILLAHGAALLA